MIVKTLNAPDVVGRVSARVLASMCLLTLVAGTGLALGSDKKPLTLERLYSAPSLIGTQPRGVAWAPDSRSAAFLWNDEGTSFNDVWLLRIATGETERLTRLARPALVEAGRLSGEERIEALNRNSSAEMDRGVREVAWYPDSRRLMFPLGASLYEITPGQKPQVIGSSDAAVADLSFSSDGEFRGFRSAGGLWLTLVSNWAPFPVEVAENRRVESYSWSPDGSRIAFIEVDPGEVPFQQLPDYLADSSRTVRVRRPFPGDPTPSRRLGVFTLATRTTSWLQHSQDPREPIWSYHWSPDSTRILVDTSDFFIKSRRILEFSVADSRPVEWYREEEPNNVTPNWAVRWAPAGNAIFFLSDRQWDYHIYRLSAPGGDVEPMTSGRWAVESFEISASRGRILLTANQGRPEERQVFELPLDGGSPERVSSRAGTHRPAYSPDGRYGAVRFSSDSSPPDLLLTQLEAGPDGKRRENAVTHSPLPEFDEYRWVTSKYVSWKSHHDGATLHGRLTLPPDHDPERRYPAIIGSVYSNTVRNQWGGRTAHPTWGLDQLLAQQGYVLFNVDIRGSWGHGKTFRQQLIGDYGGIDVEDLESGVLHLIDEGLVDPARVGIWGSSYGGLLTCMSLFKKPGRYKAGIAGAPATNVWHAFPEQMWVMGHPDRHAERFLDSSAFSHAEGLQDPLMIVHGMRDRVVLFKDSIVLLQRLVLLGKDVDFVTLPDSGHGWDAEELYQTRFAFRKMVEFFDRHLKGDD